MSRVALIHGGKHASHTLIIEVRGAGSTIPREVWLHALRSAAAECGWVFAEIDLFSANPAAPTAIHGLKCYAVDLGRESAWSSARKELESWLLITLGHNLDFEWVGPRSAAENLTLFTPFTG